VAKVSVTINNRKYQIACEDGQEAHLSRLGAYVDRRISELVASIGQVGDSQLLVMASLLIADELSDAYSEVEGLRPGDQAAPVRIGVDESVDESVGESYGESFENLAARIEDVAARMKQA
jgi:cell division protein ZapA